MNRSMTGQYVQKDSVLHKMDARAKLLCFILLLVVMLKAKTVFSYGLAAVTLVAVCALSKLSFSALTSTLSRMTTFLIVIFLMNALFFSTQEAIWKWGIFTLSREGIVQGLHVVAHVVQVLVLSNLLTCTTTPIELTTALEVLLKPLKVFRIPVEMIALVLSVALSFIPTLLQEADTIRKAQIARGARFESRNLIEKARSFLPLILPIFLCAFRRADELSLAMEARGYRGAAKRTKKAKIPLKKSDLLTLGICSCICAVQFFL